MNDDDNFVHDDDDMSLISRFSRSLNYSSQFMYYMYDLIRKFANKKISCAQTKYKSVAVSLLTPHVEKIKNELNIFFYAK